VLQGSLLLLILFLFYNVLLLKALNQLDLLLLPLGFADNINLLTYCGGVPYVAMWSVLWTKYH
jgi:hypothetical protein